MEEKPYKPFKIIKKSKKKGQTAQENHPRSSPPPATLKEATKNTKFSSYT